MRVCIFGDSHVGSLQRAWTKHCGSMHDLATIDFFSAHGAYWGRFEHEITDSKISVRSNALRGRQPLELDIIHDYDRIVFSSPLHSSPTFRHRIWRKYCLPEQADEHPEHHVISHAVGEAWIQRRLLSRFNFLDALRSKLSNIIVLEPPKPLYRVPGRYKLSPSLVVAADNLHRQVVVDWLAAKQIEILHSPEFTYSDGLTLQAYSAALEGDPHHGSYKYSIAMLEKILGLPHSTPSEAED